MKTDSEERLKMDISDAFDFVRFLIKHPRTLGKIKNGAVIRFVPAGSRGLARPYPPSKRNQAFLAETVFHGL